MLTEAVGSLFHMAPELLAGQDYDHRVDLYAFGILMFEMLHPGSRPYPNVATGMPDSLTREEFSKKVAHEQYRPVWRHPNEALRKLAEQCWATDPALRPEFREIMKRLASPSFTPSPTKAVTASPHDHKTGIACTIGEVRNHMEDAIALLDTPERLICGVFDGLRGDKTAELAAWRLPLALADDFAKEESDPDAIIRREFALTDKTLKHMIYPENSGSTATIAVINDKDIRIAWLGDSPAWLFHKTEGKKPTLLINPHHPDRNDEIVRLKARGAEIRREEHMLDNGETVPWGPARVYCPKQEDNGGIALSRALNLPPFSNILSCEPEITLLKRSPDDLFLTISSDGIFEVLTPEIIGQLLNAGPSPQHLADTIIKTVLEKGAPDNASLITVSL